ncbi:MAG TPA: YfhO family protein [Thermoanaerobaculia bacterium]|nr:YfhO family protein [Thermoanaerobaculia bacterium]
MAPAPLPELLFFAVGSALLGVLLRVWRPELSWRLIGGYALLVMAFLAPTLLTPRHPIATDLAYPWLPWRAGLEREVRPANPLLSDPVLQMLPFQHLVRQRLLAGRPPLWTHELATGEPLLGNAQSAPFAPLKLLALPLSPLATLEVAAAWQILLALLFTHALARKLGTSPVAATFAAVAFSFSTFAVAWLYYPLGMTAAFLPGLLLGVLALDAEEPRSLLALAVIAAAMALCGHPETLTHGALVAGIVALVLAMRRPAGRWRFLSRFAGAAGLGFCFAAPALLPFAQAALESWRMALVELAPGAVEPPPFEARFLAVLVDPLFFGSPRFHTWKGPWNWNELASAYAGISTLAFAGFALVEKRGRWLLGGALAALAVALKLPPFFQLFELLPLLGHGANGRLRLVWVLGLALAAGLGLDRYAREGRWLLRLLPLCAALLLSAALAPERHPDHDLWWIGAVGGLALLLLPVRHAGFRAWVPHLAVLGLVADLFLLGQRYNPAVAPEMDLRPTPAVAALQQATAREDGPVRVLARGYGLYPHTGALYGLWDPRGGDPMQPAAAARFALRSLPDQFLPEAPRDRPELGNAEAVLAFLRVGLRLTERRRELPAPWRVIHEGPGVRVWSSPAVLPLFFVPRRTEVVANAEAAFWASLRSADFAETVWLPAGAGPASRTNALGRANVLALGPNRLRLAVEGEGGFLASSVAHASGWRAVAGGGRVPVVAANGAFLGVEVPPGAAEVDLVFLPGGWVVGLVLLAGGLVVATVIGLRPPGRGGPARGHAPTRIPEPESPRYP